MVYEDKRYWLEEILMVLGDLKDKATNVADVEEYAAMSRAVEDVMEDLFRLQELED